MWQRNETALFTLPKTYEIATTETFYNGEPGLLFTIANDDTITRVNARQLSNFDRSDLVLEAVAVIGENTMLLSAGGRWIKIPLPKVEVMPGDKIAINYGYPTHPLLKEIASIELMKATDITQPTIIWQKS